MRLGLKLVSKRFNGLSQHTLIDSVFRDPRVAPSRSSERRAAFVNFGEGMHSKYLKKKDTGLVLSSYRFAFHAATNSNCKGISALLRVMVVDISCSMILRAIGVSRYLVHCTAYH
jgi:hypothetical protein